VRISALVNSLYLGFASGLVATDWLSPLERALEPTGMAAERLQRAANGGFVRHSTPDELIAFVQSEQKTWRPIMEQLASDTPK